jgi:hypothetical protein
MSVWKRSITISLACLIVVAFSKIGAQAASLKIINQSASEIHAIYISDSGSNDWEENIIDGYKLPSGNQVDIQIPSYKKFDLRVEDKGGNYEDYSEFPGNTRQITLKGGGDSAYR